MKTPAPSRRRRPPPSSLRDATSPDSASRGRNLQRSRRILVLPHATRGPSPSVVAARRHLPRLCESGEESAAQPAHSRPPPRDAWAPRCSRRTLTPPPRDAWGRCRRSRRRGCLSCNAEFRDGSAGAEPARAAPSVVAARRHLPRLCESGEESAAQPAHSHSSPTRRVGEVPAQPAEGVPFLQRGVPRWERRRRAGAGGRLSPPPATWSAANRGRAVSSDA
jgi:hypothetical protein